MVIGSLVDFSTKELVINTKDKACLSCYIVCFSLFFLINKKCLIYYVATFTGERTCKMEGVKTLTLTASMFDGLVTTITSNLGVLLPIGLTIMGIMIAVSLIPRIIYKFF